MNIDFGGVKTYKPRGFGFVRGFFHKEVFFHISKLTDKSAREYLESNKEDWDDWNEPDLYFWYSVEDTINGRVEKIWHNSQNVPVELLLSFVSDFFQWLSSKQGGTYYDDDDDDDDDDWGLDEDEGAYWENDNWYLGRDNKDWMNCCYQLFADERVSDSELNKFLALKIFVQNPHIVLPFLRESQLGIFRDNLDLPSLWNDFSRSLPGWIKEVTCKLLGEEEYNLFREERLILEEERRARKKAEKDLIKAQRLAELVQKYRANPAGIRNDLEAHNICLSCGSSDVKPAEGRHFIRVCKNCGNEWYVNHCWNCKGGRVDSRDPETPQCDVCGWYKCKNCGACHQGGCSTNPYSRYNKLK